VAGKWLDKALWSNNNAESVNHQLKLATDWKPQRLTDPVAHLRDAVPLQYSCLRRALFGQGDYQLAPVFHMQHYVPFVRWLVEWLHQSQAGSAVFSLY